MAHILIDLPPDDGLLAMALRTLGFKARDVKELVDRSGGETLDARIRAALALARGVTKVAASTTKVDRESGMRSLDEWCARWLAAHPEPRRDPHAVQPDRTPRRRDSTG